MRHLFAINHDLISIQLFLHFENDFLPKVKIELVVDDKKYKEAIEVIIKHSNTGKIGDGKISVKDLEENAIKRLRKEPDETEQQEEIEEETD